MIERDEIVSNEFITTVRIQLSNEQTLQLSRYLNLHYLGDVNANELDENGFYCPKYPEKETQEFKDAMWRAQAYHEFRVKAVFDVHGICKMELL